MKILSPASVGLFFFIQFIEKGFESLYSNDLLLVCFAATLSFRRQEE